MQKLVLISLASCAIPFAAQAYLSPGVPVVTGPFIDDFMVNSNSIPPFILQPTQPSTPNIIVPIVPAKSEPLAR